MNHDEAATQQVKCLGSWFGGSTDKKTLPTHTHTPKLFIIATNVGEGFRNNLSIYLIHLFFLSLSLKFISFSLIISLYFLSLPLSLSFSLFYSPLLKRSLALYWLKFQEDAFNKEGKRSSGVCEFECLCVGGGFVVCLHTCPCFQRYAKAARSSEVLGFTGFPDIFPSLPTISLPILYYE